MIVQSKEDLEKVKRNPTNILVTPIANLDEIFEISEEYYRKLDKDPNFLVISFPFNSTLKNSTLINSIDFEGEGVYIYNPYTEDNGKYMKMDKLPDIVKSKFSYIELIFSYLGVKTLKIVYKESHHINEKFSKKTSSNKKLQTNSIDYNVSVGLAENTETEHLINNLYEALLSIQLERKTKILDIDKANEIAKQTNLDENPILKPFLHSEELLSGLKKRLEISIKNEILKTKFNNF